MQRFVFIGSASNQNVNDYVSVNFGEKQFKYNTSGFASWSNMPKQISCKYQKKAVFRTELMVFFLITWS